MPFPNPQFGKEAVKCMPKLEHRHGSRKIAHIRFRSKSLVAAYFCAKDSLRRLSFTSKRLLFAPKGVDFCLNHPVFQ